MTARSWTRGTFIVLALLHLAPLCSVRYLPTGDGPTHIYNAWVLHELVTGDAPPNLARAYRIDWKPHPNWTGHALLALAMSLVPPLVAEKLLVALILITILAGTWFLATSVDPRNDLYAFLAFPLLWTQSLLAGYYNFSLSIGLFLFILGVWWRRGSVLLLAALLVLCNFTHPMAAGLACGSIVLLSLLLRRFRHLIALIPTLALLAMFGRTAQANLGEPLQWRIDWSAASILARMETLYAFDDRVRPIAVVLALTYLALIIRTLTRKQRRDADAIGILALALIAMMFWLPAAQGTRELFTGRMQPFVFLILPAWFAPIERRRTAFLAFASLLALVTGAYAFERIRTFGREMNTLVRTFDRLEPGGTLLPLLFERPHSFSYVNLFAHFPSYVALEKRLVDLSNYEPSTHYFPITYRDPAPGTFAIDFEPGTIDLAQPALHADFVITHRYPADAPNRGTLRRLYRLVDEDGPFAIYERKSQAADPYDLILLPLLGSPIGARWTIDQSLHNRDSRPLRVVFHQCANDLWCDRELAPGEIVSIATAERRFAYLEVPRGRDALLGVTTTARRVDIDRPETSISVPAIPQREFARGTTRIRGIDTRDGMKIGLRVYVFGDSASHDVTLRVRAGDALVHERRFSLDNFGMWEDGDLRSHVDGVPLPPSVDVEIMTNANVWAFATLTDDRDRTIVLRSHP